MKRIFTSTLIVFTALALMVGGLTLAGCGSGGSSGGGGVSSQVPGGNATAEAPLAKKLTLAWDPVVGASSYNLYWSTDPNVTPASGNKISVVNNSYVHTGLAAGTTYYYVVTAVDNTSESAASNPVSKTTGL